MDITERRIIVREGRRYSVLSQSEVEQVKATEPYLLVLIGDDWCLDESLAEIVEEFANEAIGF